MNDAFVERIMLAREVHDWNALTPMEVIELVLAKLIEDNRVHPKNALLAIVVILAGIVIEVSVEHPENVLGLILVNSACVGRVMLVRAAHP